MPTRYDRDKILTVLKKDDEHKWLNDVSNAALQQSNADLQKAYENFFRRVKKGKKPGFPRFKSKHGSKNSYRETRGVILNSKAIKLPKIGKVKAKIHRKVEGRVLNVTVSRTPAGRYFAAFIVETEEPEKLPKVDKSVGIDLGLKDFAVFSDGVKIDNPHNGRKSAKKLAKAQKSLARKQKGSNNREKARRKVAKIHAHIMNQRNWFLHNLSLQIIRENQVIAVEGLAVKNMAAKGGAHKRGLNRGIKDASWGRFLELLKYKAAWYGRELVVIDRYYPSTQICSRCGDKTGPKGDLSIRNWTCGNCSVMHDRDVNAAKNILARGLASSGIGASRPDFKPVESV